MRKGISRRQFMAHTAGAIGSIALGSACAASELQQSRARISARPGAGVKTTGSGSRPLGLGDKRDAILHLPPKYGEGALPLLVLLHGAGGSGTGILNRLMTFADESGVAVLSPDSRGSTWDAISGNFGADVTFISKALQATFESVSVDPERLALGGFSDGATYAISLGLQNGDLFRRIIAWSPGFFVGGESHGKPRLFISHGTADQILPIDRCSRVIVPALKKAGYDVTFRQFDGGHEMPPTIARAGMQWLVDRT
ncbi:MAG TPA: alpha/beta hydrolase-fold protein [Vicinamibacterales bacterium]|nr:alpha/beta hydrolase-fold protein [Vicinamibacterales bacterium]